MGRDLRAFVFGLAVFVALYMLYWIALATPLDESPAGHALMGLGYAIPLVAGGVTAYFSGEHQFAAVLSLGVVGSVVIAVINSLASAVGMRVDFPGLTSIPLVAALSLLVQVPLVLLGGAVVGLWLRSRHA